MVDPTLTSPCPLATSRGSVPCHSRRSQRDTLQSACVSSEQRSDGCQAHLDLAAGPFSQSVCHRLCVLHGISTIVMETRHWPTFLLRQYTIPLCPLSDRQRRHLLYAKGTKLHSRMILLDPSPDLLNCRLRARRFGHDLIPQIRAVQRCREEYRSRGVRRYSQPQPLGPASHGIQYKTGPDDDIPRPSQMGGRRRILRRSGSVLVLNVAVCFVSDLSTPDDEAEGDAPPPGSGLGETAS